jgi:hypothetical protein
MWMWSNYTDDLIKIIIDLVKMQSCVEIRMEMKLQTAPYMYVGLPKSTGICKGQDVLCSV